MEDMKKFELEASEPWPPKTGGSATSARVSCLSSMPGRTTSCTPGKIDIGEPGQEVEVARRVTMLDVVDEPGLRKALSVLFLAYSLTPNSSISS